MNSEPLQKELFVLFFTQGELYLEQLEEALRDNDGQAWRMTAHGIKGASRSLGLTRLATIAMHAEKSEPDARHLAILRHTLGETRGAVWPQEDAA